MKHGTKSACPQVSEKKSHIQLPKLLLRRFEDEKGLLAYYDVQKKVIGSHGHAKSLNTEKDYYSNLGEDYWNIQVEGVLSKLLKALDKADTDLPRSTLPNDFDATSKKYLHSLIARSPNAHQNVQDTSIYLQLMDLSNQHDIESSTIFSLAQQNGYFNEWITTILVNKSEVPFLLPMCGAYEYGYKDVENFIVMPIDPYKAIQMVPPSGINLFCEHDHIKFALMNKDALVKRLNVFAFENQINRGYGYIISNDIDSIRETEEMYSKQQMPFTK